VDFWFFVCCLHCFTVAQKFELISYITVSLGTVYLFLHVKSLIWHRFIAAIYNTAVCI
jgi:hypothetical protein